MKQNDNRKPKKYILLFKRNGKKVFRKYITVFRIAPAKQLICTLTFFGKIVD